MTMIMVKARQKKTEKRFFLFPLLLIVLVGILWLISRLIFTGTWEGKSRLTVIFITQPVIVASFNPADQSLTAISLPSDTYVEASHGYGQYRLGKVYDVGNLDQRGGEVLKSTVRELLGIPIDGYIDLQKLNFGKTDNLTSSEFISRRQQILGWLTFLGALEKKSKTDLKAGDLWRFYASVQAVKAGKITFVNLAKAQVLVPQTLPDGTNILAADQVRLDGLLTDLFREDNIASENFKIAVLNSTNTSGLGDRAARIINNMGIQVVSVGNFQPQLESCQLNFSKNLEKSLTALKLKRVFGCEIKKQPFPEVRADITLIVGKKYSQELVAR